MIPEPLHPAVVHFPIVLSVLLPIFALGALWAIRRDAAPWRAWALPLALAVALTASAFVALRTGESQEERVEEVVAEAPLHEHEEAAERFMLFSGILTVVAVAGLLGGTLGSAARIVATVGSVVVLGAGYQVGDLGGELVYEHGAAQAWIDDAPTTVDGGVAEAPPSGPTASTPRDRTPPGPRGALPGLFGIMAGLQIDMARVGEGIWMGDFDTVAAGARAVADHPRVPPEEADVIGSTLGSDMSRFAAMDARVHDGAIQLAEAADRRDLDAVLAAEAALRRDCTSCHTAFRERLRSEIR